MMKNAGTKIAIAALTLVGACGGRDTDTLPAVDGRSMSAELRLKGANPGPYRALLVEVLEVKVTAAGRALDVAPGQQQIDLSNTGHAWLLGTVRVPHGTDRLKVEVILDDFAGYETDGDAGHVDMRGSEISFDAPVPWLAQHGMATVDLDLQRSLVARKAGEKVLLPNLNVRY